jgi:CO/xanthine dehydrogenase Mo-binding subunit
VTRSPSTTTQWPYSVRATLAAAFGVPEDRIRVLAPFVGGGFGAGLRVWPHVVLAALAALAARTAGRPVKLVLTRPLAHAIGMDPVELRLRNYAEDNPQLGLPWSSKALRACYQKGAERFGWWARDPRPGSMRDGDWLVGYGMAGVSFFWSQPPCQARASIRRNGTAFVRSAATDIGTGTYTVMTQLSAELLGLRLDQVRFGLGDTDMPMAPMQGGSGLTAALGNAVRAASRQLIQAFLDTVADDRGSPRRGCRLDDVRAASGRIHHISEPARGEAYTAILARHGLDELAADGDSAPPKAQDVGMAPSGAFAARFVPVNADVPELEVIFVGEPDRFNPIGVKGVGEVGLVGMAAAIANAVFHATGRRIRSLPITIDRLL